MATENGVDFPKKSEIPNFPPVMDRLSGGTTCCPFMGVNVLTLPIIPKGGLLQAGPNDQVGLVREYTPCVRELCQLWSENSRGCGMLDRG